MQVEKVVTIKYIPAIQQITVDALGVHIVWEDAPRQLLSREELVQLRNALNVAIDHLEGAAEPPAKPEKTVWYGGEDEPPASVTRLLDREGDKWFRREGGWTVPSVGNSLYRWHSSDMLLFAPFKDIT